MFGIFFGFQSINKYTYVDYLGLHNKHFSFYYKNE